MNHFSLLLQRRWKAALITPALHRRRQSFRSRAALDALQAHIRPASAAGAGAGAGAEAATDSRHLVLYNYPSFSGAFAALFAHLYHSRLRLPCLILPLSSVEPLRVDDFRPGGIETCYLLDSIGPNDFAVHLSLLIPRVIAFDHRASTMARIQQLGPLPESLELNIDTNKSSARAVYDYFSEKLTGKNSSSSEELVGLLSREDGGRIATVLRYIEDVDLRRWELPDIEAFNIGLRDERAKLNSVTNPHVFKQLLEIDSADLIAKGKSCVISRQDAANKLLGKAFKIRLGRGLYGECLAIRADGSSNLSHEIGVELSRRSAAAGLSRPIGAVVFMQRTNLKMCLRSTDSATDTSEIAKAYGGGGNYSSSSFIIRMDEYNHWTSVNSL